MATERPTKRPSFQWYPGDAMRDVALGDCCLEARGLWREMMDLMHDGEPYGFLTAGGVPISDVKLAGKVQITARRCTVLLTELEAHGVFSRTEEGVIYSRRMVRDEARRNARGAGGPKSLEHPNVPQRKDGTKDPPKDTTKDPPKEGAADPSFDPSPAVAVAVASASATTSVSQSAREALLAVVPNRVAWEQEFLVAKQGMHGKAATDQQVEDACRHYLANGKAEEPSVRLWLGYLRRAVAGEKLDAPRPTNTDRAYAALKDV